MRDRESDSWWSLMTSQGIGGELEGKPMVKLDGGEKATFGDWKQRHPETLVLSIDGVEHDESNPYENYFGNEKTFRDLVPGDDRLPPKENIYSFHSEGKAYAVAHSKIEGGARFDIGLKDGALLLYREAGASFYASTEAYLVDPASSIEDLLEARAEQRSFAGGFDTFWYNWVGQNPDSEILQ
jgi:hypothetical protein